MQAGIREPTENAKLPEPVPEPPLPEPLPEPPPVEPTQDLQDKNSSPDVSYSFGKLCDVHVASLEASEEKVLRPESQRGNALQNQPDVMSLANPNEEPDANSFADPDDQPDAMADIEASSSYLAGEDQHQKDSAVRASQHTSVNSLQVETTSSPPAVPAISSSFVLPSTEHKPGGKSSAHGEPTIVQMEQPVPLPALPVCSCILMTTIIQQIPMMRIVLV